MIETTVNGKNIHENKRESNQSLIEKLAVAFREGEIDRFGFQPSPSPVNFQKFIIPLVVTKNHMGIIMGMVVYI